MDYFAQNWGSFAGALGVVVSAVGLWYAFKANRAATSAEQAARQARQALARTIGSIDVERAVALITRLMEVHRQSNWEYALGLYQDLRRTLSEVGTSMPSDLNEHKEAMAEAVPQITVMINLINKSIENNDNGPADVFVLNETLNGVQQSLELLQAVMLHTDDLRGD